MRRALGWIVALLLAAAAPSWAEELKWLSPTIGGNDAVMIVDNGSDWRTRLNLRAEPHKGSDIRGRIYTGTRVEIYEDYGQWCLVGLNLTGNDVLTGCVMKQYLTPVGREFSALCPLAAAVADTAVTSSTGDVIAQLKPGDQAHVLAVCGDRYYLMTPDIGQGYAPASAFAPLSEPEEGSRIVYRTFYVPAGGLTFADDRNGWEITLSGGVQLEDCWQIEGETQWHVTFGAGIQRPPRVHGCIPQEALSPHAGPFDFGGEVYAYEKSFIVRVGTEDGTPILRRTLQNGDVRWAAGDVPREAVLLESDPYIIECEPTELLTQEMIDGVFAYLRAHHPLDERTCGQSVNEWVNDALIDRCRLRTSLVFEPTTGELIIRAWLEEDGDYVTGGDLDPKSGAVTRWGCNA